MLRREEIAPIEDSRAATSMTVATPATTTGRLFDEDFRRRLERLRLVVRRTSPGGLHGEHRSRRRGRGIEFSDYRAYVPGDDMRDVHWLAYLRFDRLLLRLFEEEGDLPVYLLLDSSRSMSTPDAAKFDQARRVLAALGCIALAQADRVAVAAFASGVREVQEPLRGGGQIHRLLRFLERVEPSGGGSDLAGAIRAYFARPRRPGLVVIASDFLVDDVEERGASTGPVGLESALALVAALRHRLLALHLEQDLDVLRPATPRFDAVDSESGERIRFDSTATLFREVRRQADLRADAIRAACRRRSFTYLRVSERERFDDVVLRLLRERGPLR